MVKDEINLKTLKVFCLHQDTSISGIARAIKKSRQAIYGSLKEPAKFPRTYLRVINLIEGKQ